MVSTRKKNCHNKKRPNQLDGTLKNFVIDNGITAITFGNETFEPQANGCHEDLEKIVDNTCQNQVIRNNTDDRVRDMVDSAVFAVESCMRDAILTAMNNVVIP